MGSAYRLAFPGALLVSFVLAFAGLFITANLDTPASHAAAAPALAEPAAPEAATADVEKEQTSPPEKEITSDCQVSLKYPESIRRWCGLITAYARQHGLEPDLIAALIWQESGGNPQAYSRSGAVGLMQVMPRDGLAAEFMCKNGPCFANRPTINELQDPEFNVQYGTRMLAGLSARYGNLRDALLHYGPKDVGYYYADIVLRLYEDYKQ
jgi:hypothetical protein